MRHALLHALSAAAALAALAPADADACSIFVPPTQRLSPSGEVAQGAGVFVERGGGYEPSVYVLTNQDGEVFEHAFIEEGRVHDERGYGGARFRLEPDVALPPGTYTLTEDGDPRNDWGVEPELYDTTTTFTITADLPPEGAPVAPSLSWAAVAYDGPEDPDLFPPNDSCSPTADGKLASYRIEVAATTQGYITIRGEDASGNELYTLDTVIEAAPEHTVILADYEDTPLTQCVTATVTDLYGNTSEPTRSCQPDGCTARHRNDRDPIDWADVAGCSDWSPGYADRNAPACACAQVPSSPSGSPAALALGLLGLFALRRRS
jgi:MYXO-CTERM domain-containing protein